MKKQYHFAFNLAIIFISIFASIRTFAQAPFNCNDGVSYLIKGSPSSLYTVNLRTGAQTLLFDAAKLGNRNLSGLGYNVVNNELYAYIAGTNDIAIIGSDGIVVTFDVPNLPIANYTAGDVTVIGGIQYLYLYEAATKVMQRVNLSSHSANTISLTQGATVSDISINKEGTQIYSVSAITGTLVNWSTAGGALTYTNVGIDPLSASTFMDITGDLFVVSDSSSSVYEISGPNHPITISATRVTPNLLTKMANTDGARCVNSLATNVQPKFSCTPNEAFVVTSGLMMIRDCKTISTSPSVLKTYDLSTGTITATSPPLIQDYKPRSDTSIVTHVTLNNLGFNPTDQYLWAYRYATNQIVRIGQDNSIDYFAIQGLSNECYYQDTSVVVNALFNSGDINNNGVMYLLNGLSGDRFSRIDLNPASPTYLTKLSDIKLSPIYPGSGGLGLIQDVAFNPIDNQLYTVNSKNKLIRINPDNGVVTILGDVKGLPAKLGQGYVVAYFDNEGTLYVQRSKEQDANIKDIVRIPNVATGNLSATIFAQTEPIVGGDGARCPYTEITPSLFAISGNVFDDGNGLNDPSGAVVNLSGSGALNPVNESTLGTQLYITLVNSDGVAIQTVPLSSNGSYRFDNVTAGDYSTVLSTNPAGTTQANSPLPSGWNNTGEQIGNTPGTTDGTPNGIVTGIKVVDANVTNVNFGINKKPEVVDGKDASRMNPGGNIQSPVAAALFRGSDLEDGSYPNNLNGRTVNLEPGTGGDIYYNGVLVVANDPPIKNFDPSLVTADPEGTSKGVSVNVIFTYTVTDNAGVTSDPKTITVPFTLDPLPVTLVSFTVQNTESNSATLKWATTAETQSERFEIEKSTNAKEWTKIGSVAAKGESTILVEYNYLDPSLSNGANYYRLKMIDLDQTFSYSQIKSIVNSENIQPLSVYPNPTSDLIHLKDINFNEVNQIRLINSLGKTVFESNTVSNQGIDVSKFSEGLYILKLTNKNGSQISRKVVIIR